MSSCNLRDYRRLLATPIGINLLRIDLTLDLYAKNPFRILVTPAWLEDDRRDALIQRFRNLYKLRPEAAMKNVLRIGYEEFTEIHDPIKFLNDLREPRRRLVWELFWPHVGQEDFNGISAKGALTIPTNDLFLTSISLDEKATTSTPIAREKENSERERLTAAALEAHTLAILYQNRALAIELLINHATTESTRAHSCRLEADEHWRKSLEYWAATKVNPLFWEYIKTRIKIFDDPQLHSLHLEPLRDQLPAAILAFNATFVRAYVGAGCIEDAARHVRLIGVNSFHLPDQRAIMVGLLREVMNAWLNPLVQKLENQRPRQIAPWKEAQEWLIPIIESAEKLPAEMKEKFAVDETIITEIHFDLLAEKVFNGMTAEVIDYQQSNSRALLFSILVCRRILRLPISTSLRRRVEERRSEYTENLYGRFHINAHQARLLDPGECWFLPGESADPESSILLPVYKITSEKGKQLLWHSREVLVPRSYLAKTLNFGNTVEVTERRQAEIKKINQMIEDLEREAENNRNQLESAYASSMAQEESYRQTRIRMFDEEVAIEESTLQTKIQEIEDLFRPRIAEVKTRLMAARSAATDRWAPALTLAREKVTRLEPLRRMARIHFPIAGAIGFVVTLLLTFSTIKAWILQYLAPLELTLRQRFHAPDRMVNYLPILVAILLSVILTMVLIEIILAKKVRAAQQALKKIEVRQEETLAWVEGIFQEQHETIIQEQETKVMSQRAKLAIIAERREKLTQEMNRMVDNIKNRHQQEIERGRIFEDRLSQLRQLLVIYQNPAKTFDNKSNFPAYVAALEKGYLPGERPPKQEAKNSTRHGTNKLWPF
ncbi:hypothetical protein CCP3SC5AM1_250002 [Gammaproteobacteria bacterium]